MKAKIISLNPLRPDASAIREAADVILRGGLVAFPTETVYGLGANALNPKAVRKIFVAKNRPANNPLIVHIAAISEMKRYAVNIPDIAYTLGEVFWPGPLTLVLRKRNLDTIALRIPRHPVALALLSVSKVPIAAPSANRSTRPSPTTANHVIEDLGGSIDLILDAGPTAIGVESTVVDVTVDPPVILRPGGVTLEELKQYAPAITSGGSDVNKGPIRSPGLRHAHYKPNAKVILVDRNHASGLVTLCHAQNQRVATLSVGEILDTKTDACVIVSNVREYARQLFSAFRLFDEQGIDVILAEAVPPVGLGLAVMDRLKRAAD